MPAEDFYYTIDAAVRAPELKVKGSRFVADLFPVTTKGEIENALVKLRKEFHDATHHCFAYRLGPEGLLIRAADDGEPSGTAGKPILLVLTSQKLTNTLLVVTRYYGGTNLGTGGLARAYAESAQQAVSLARIDKIFLTSSLIFQVQYEDLQVAERLVGAFEGSVDETTYLESVTLHVSIRLSFVDKFRAAVIDTLHGKVEFLPSAPTPPSS